MSERWARLACACLAAIAVQLATVRASADDLDACDVGAKVCCRGWEVRAVCSNRRAVASEGRFGTWTEAKNEADNANSLSNSCTPGFGACREKLYCASREAAIGTPYCAPANRFTGPLARREAIALLAVLQQNAAQLEGASRDLQTFQSSSDLTDRAKRKAGQTFTRAASLATRLTDAQKTVTALCDAPDAKLEDTQKAATAQRSLLRDAASAVADATSVISDPGSIDRTHEERAAREEREKQAREQAARKREEAAARKAEEDARKKAEAAARKAEQEAKKSATAAARKAEEDAKKAAAEAARKAEEEARKAEAAGRRDETKKRQDDEAAARKAAAETPSSQNKPPPAAPPEPYSIPVCEIDLSAEGDLASAAVTIDGSRRVSLPARLKISSSRHRFAVRRGTTEQVFQELILCGRVDRVVLGARTGGAK